MDPGATRRRPWRRGFPRTRGDGPHLVRNNRHATTFPPHARGWTRLTHGRLRTEDVSPARAGMDPVRNPRPGLIMRFPRTRGDGPDQPDNLPTALAFPPHARGWTAGRSARPPHDEVSPARAGMDPGGARRGRRGRRFPRTRGDGPWWRATRATRPTFPPHARGWTRRRYQRQRHHRVSPARAGMDRIRSDARRQRRSFPRTRGDGPQQRLLDLGGQRFPPHARGWTVDRRCRGESEVVSPARAGMDPRRT